MSYFIVAVLPFSKFVPLQSSESNLEQLGKKSIVVEKLMWVRCYCLHTVNLKSCLCFASNAHVNPLECRQLDWQLSRIGEEKEQRRYTLDGGTVQVWLSITSFLVLLSLQNNQDTISLQLQKPNSILWSSNYCNNDGYKKLQQHIS